MNRFIYKFFSGLTIFFMLWGIETSLLVPRTAKIFSVFREQYNERTVTLMNLLCLIAAIIIIIFIKKIVQLIYKKQGYLSDKFTIIFFFGELIVYLAVLLTFIHYIGFDRPVDDTRIVLNALEELKTQGQFGYGYMYSNPQNLLLMYLFKIIQGLFGISYLPLMVCFCVLHAFTIVVVFFTLKNFKIYNFVSLLTVQILFFALQLSLHSAVAYTDILALFFMSLSLFFFSKYLTKINLIGWRKGLYLALTAFFAMIGFISKGTLLILIIALVLFVCLKESRYHKLYAVLPVLFLAAGNFGWQLFIDSQAIYPDNNYGQPNTHYIMMGLSGADRLNETNQSALSVGVYNGSDQDYSWDLFLKQKLPKKEIMERQLSVAANRWHSLDTVEKVSFMNLKAASTWSSGDLKSSFEISLGVNPQKNHFSLFENRITGAFFYGWMMVIQDIIYVGIILAVIHFFKRFNYFIYFSTIFISGYFTFLLLWEASPRYAMGIYLPALLMMGIMLNDVILQKTNKNSLQQSS